MKMKSISGLLFIALMAFALSMVTGFNPAIVAIVLLVASLVPMPKGVMGMAVTVEVWENDILANLFKNNGFAKRAYSADQYVLAGKVVHIPRAGTPSAITKNLSSFPAVAVKRSDDDVTYPIDTFYTTPRHVEKIEQYELSYDKRASVLGEDQLALIDTTMDSLLFNWLPLVANTVLTSGAATPATIDGGTGNRLAFSKADLKAIKLKMDKAKIPDAGRVALLTADHFYSLYESLSEGERTNFNNVGNLAEGTVARYYGFDISMRNTVGRYRGADGAFVKVDEYGAGYGASNKTADRAASLIYHEQCAERALGGVEMFDRTKDPLYYGDVYSFTLRMGGRIRRDAGVWAVVEALSA